MRVQTRYYCPLRSQFHSLDHFVPLCSWLTINYPILHFHLSTRDRFFLEVFCPILNCHCHLDSNSSSKAPLSFLWIIFSDPYSLGKSEISIYPSLKSVVYQVASLLALECPVLQNFEGLSKSIS